MTDWLFLRFGPNQTQERRNTMENQINSNQFRDEEIVIMSHWDKKNEEWVRTVYPKIGGRLRLAHEDNDNMSITTEIIKYDENIAVVRAVSTIAKGVAIRDSAWPVQSGTTRLHPISWSWRKPVLSPDL